MKVINFNLIPTSSELHKSRNMNGAPKLNICKT